LKPAPGKKLEKPYLEKPITKKRTGVVAQGVGPEFKPQYLKKKKCFEDWQSANPSTEKKNVFRERR
jgi:hypothetical protein